LPTWLNPANPCGNFNVPSLTWDRASSLQLDASFHARISGHVYAQPLFWRGSESNSEALLVATEDNIVHAIDAVMSASASCGHAGRIGSGPLRANCDQGASQQTTRLFDQLGGDGYLRVAAALLAV
jgi:hypothetical protein